jgi:hypothetical protein
MESNNYFTFFYFAYNLLPAIYALKMCCLLKGKFLRTTGLMTLFIIM